MMERPPVLAWTLAADIGTRLRELREALDWTQEDLGKELGRGRQSVVHWEAGRVKPPRRRLEELCRRHHWPLELFAEGGPRPRDLLLTKPGSASQDLGVAHRPARVRESSAAASVATLQTELRNIDAGLTDGSLTPEGLADLKSAVDDVRLRLWGALIADQPADTTFRQRFRITRVAEICRSVAADLQDGALPWSQPDLQTLAGVAGNLATRITAGPRASPPRS
jgi:transcriptional regulator with XRE-family HTH domain